MTIRPSTFDPGPTGWDPVEQILIEHMAASSRGPKREGCFALWLLVRVARDLWCDPPLPERAMRRRLQSLERRLATLTLPAPLRRGIVAALLRLRPGNAAGAREAVALLVAPARESLGDEIGRAMERANSQQPIANGQQPMANSQ